MKLLIITAVKTFEERVKMVFDKNLVFAYSYDQVTGYRNSSKENGGKNWFGTDMYQVSSLMFFAFVSEATSEKIFLDIEDINKTCDIRSRIHIAITSIEKYNNSLKKIRS